MFITLEGVDRSGKSTQAAVLAQKFGNRALLVREPGGTELAERVRSLVKDPALEMGAISETLLFAAARADLVETAIRPALADGKIVICDRFGDSTAAYQGGARGLGIERIEELNSWATGDLVPDLTLLFEIDVEAAAARAGEADRFEDEGADLQRRVAAAYDELASRHPERFVRIDATRSQEEVGADVVSQLEQRGVAFS